MPLCYDNFTGLQVKGDTYTQGVAITAIDVDLSCGRLDAWRNPLLVAELPSDTCSIYKKQGKFRYARQSGTTVLPSLSGLVFSSDPCDCLRVRKDWCSPEVYNLGLPRPNRPELIGLSPEPTDEDCWTPELVSIKITYEFQCGHHKFESQPSLSSNEIKCKLDDLLDVVIPPPPTDKYPITKVCVYMTYTTWNVAEGLHGYPALGRNLQGRAPEVVTTNFETNAEIECFKVAEADYNPNGQTITLTKDKCFGKRLRTMGWRAPDVGLCLAGESDTGSLVAYNEDCLQFSVRNHPEAWRLADTMTFGDKIMFVCHKNLQTYVITQCGDLFIVIDDNDCTEKGSCRSVNRICSVPVPCVTKHNKDKATLCDRYGVIYPSEEGLIHVRPDGTIANILPTDNDRYRWSGEISLALHRDHLFIGGMPETFVMTLPVLSQRIDSLPTTLSTLSFCPKCWYSDGIDLFMLDCDGKVYEWNAGDECMSMCYTVHLTRIQGLNFTTASVEYTNLNGTESPSTRNTLILEKNGKTHSVNCFTSCKPKRVKRIANAKAIGWTYKGKESVRRVCVGTSIQDLGAG